MAEVHKSGAKEPFLWNHAATAAGRNRKAVASADSILTAFRRKSKLSAGAKCGKTGRTFRENAGKTPEVRGNAHIQAKKSGFSGLTGHVTMIVMMEQHDHLPRIPPGGGPRKERDTSAPFRHGGFCKEVPSVGIRTARRTARRGPAPPAPEKAQAPPGRSGLCHRDDPAHRRRHLRHARRDFHDLCQDHPGPHPGCGHQRLQSVPVHHRLLHGQGDRGGCGAGDPEGGGIPHPGGLRPDPGRHVAGGGRH